MTSSESSTSQDLETDPPSYHVDLDSLSKLLYGVGAGGLKRLALSGVDIHTVGSLMTIADLCPASDTCKSQLNRRRQDQRGEALRIYDGVEIGTATNFVVDLLLQSASGTNVLAFLSSTLPVMSKGASNAAITFLFRKAGVPPDHTPGVGQLERLRDAVMPLVLRAAFKDRVLQYHSWMIKLLASKSGAAREDQEMPALKDVYESIPHEELIADLILMLHKVSVPGKNLVFEHYGINGAAWVAAFARDILGISVCVFGDAESMSPVSGNLTTAKVIIRPYECKTYCLVEDHSKVEFLCMRSLSNEERTGWVVDIGRTNYFDLHVSPDDEILKHVFNTIAGSMTKSCIEILARSFSWKLDAQHTEGLQRISEACLPFFTQRALGIMRILGFDCSTSSSSSALWKEYLCIRQRKESTECSIESRNLSRQDSIRKTRTSSHLAPTYEWNKRLRNGVVNKNGNPKFNTYGRNAISCLVKAVTFASTMAFTNWGTDFRNMSVNYLRQGDLDETHPLLWHNLIQSMLMDDVSSGFLYGELIEYILELTTDTKSNSPHHAADFTDDKNNLIATSFDGTVFIRTMAVESLADLSNPVFLSFYPGAILAASEPRQYIKSVPSTVLDAAEIVQDPKDKIIPTDAVPTLSLRHSISYHRDTINISSGIYLGRELLQSADPILISENIPTLLLSAPCGHSYNTPYQIVPTTNARKSRYADDPPSPSLPAPPPKVQTGLSFQSHLRPKHMRWTAPNGRKILYAQSVDGNKLGRWVACQWTPNLKGAVMVLQTETCLKCVDERTESREVCVINGGGDLRASGEVGAAAVEISKNVDVGGRGGDSGGMREDAESPPPPYTDDMEIGVARTKA